MWLYTRLTGHAPVVQGPDVPRIGASSPPGGSQTPPRRGWHTRALAEASKLPTPGLPSENIMLWLLTSNSTDD